MNPEKREKKENLGITQEYNRENRAELWDSARAKEEYKQSAFNGKQTMIDPISGKTLHKDHAAARRKYHMQNAEGEKISAKWAEHAAETDHINAIKDVHDAVCSNPFLSDSDLKEIVNSKENLRILSKRDNAAKGAQSDWQIITDKENGMSVQARAQMAKEKVRADAALAGKISTRTVQNMGSEFAAGASDTLVNSVIPLTSEAVRKLCEVASGEKSLKEAADEMGKITFNTAAVGGANRLISDAVNAQLRNSGNAALSGLANSSGAAQIVAVAMIVQESAMQYLNGEISGEQFVEQVGQKGASMVAGMIGGEIGSEIGAMIGGVAGTIALPGLGTAAGVAVGKVIGEVLGTIITTVACSTIVSVYSTVKHLDDHKLKERQIERLSKEALREMKSQREHFQQIVEQEGQKWDQEITAGFHMILESACAQNFDLQGLTQGLDRVLTQCGKRVRFKTLDEYEAQLDMPLKLSF